MKNVNVKYPLIYLLASGLALFVTFVLPGSGYSRMEDASFSEMFFGLSSLMFLGIFLALIIKDNFEV